MGLVATWHVGSSRTRDLTVSHELAGRFFTLKSPGKLLKSRFSIWFFKWFLSLYWYSLFGETVFSHFPSLDMVSFRSLSILKWRMLSFWLGSLNTWLPQGVERLALIYKTYWHYYDVSVPVVILLLFLLLNFIRMRVSL